MRVVASESSSNFQMVMGDFKGSGDWQGVLTWQYHVEKTLRNRIKYWLFCRFFPFKITRWDK